MEFACSHVVCNWTCDGPAPSDRSFDRPITSPSFQKFTGVSVTENEYGNTVAAKQQEAPPPLPPRRLQKTRPASIPLPPRPTFQPPLAPLSCPPPVPPRVGKLEGGGRLRANVNVVSLSVGKLVDISQVTGTETSWSPVTCGKCSAALSCLSSVQRKVWVCEFCGRENGVGDGLGAGGVGGGVGGGVRGGGDVLYAQNRSDDDYQNLEDALVVFCVDISGSMSVTTEVKSSSGVSTHISRLQGTQDALQRALSSMLQQSPRRRVALVTFADEVVIYGDGTSTPLTLRDWALVDYDHIWQQGVAYSIPHCIAETFHQLTLRVRDLREHGATCLGPAALASVAMASRYPGSKVILCTDGRANIGLGEMEQTPSPTSSPDTEYFYRHLGLQAAGSGVIVSVMSFEGTDCRLADVGRLADMTGGQVNTVSIGTVATEMQTASADNVLATGVTATLLAADGVYFPYEDESGHRLVRDVGNVTEGMEVTFQFAVKPEFTEAFLRKDTLPFQLQLSFKTRDQQRMTRIVTERRPVTCSSWMWTSSFNVAVLGVHCAQLCASLTMEGRVQEAQRQLRAQQDLLQQISEHRPIQKQESIYGNWMDTMTTICDDITTESQTLSDEAAKLVYQMKRASSVAAAAAAARQRKTERKKKALVDP